MYHGKKKFDREQLVFIANIIFAGASDRVESCLPPVISIEEYNTRKNDIHQYIAGIVATVGINLPILYAQITNDGMGTCDFVEFEQFERMVDAFVFKQTDPKTMENNIVFPDTRFLAESFVDTFFTDYLGE